VGTKVSMAHEELELGTQVLVRLGHDLGTKVLDPPKGMFYPSSACTLTCVK
jgi:hypothetical protein